MNVHTISNRSLDLVGTAAPVAQRQCDRPVSRTRHLIERGMTTAEYAVGILAAVAVALVLLQIVTGGKFSNALLKIVLDLLTKVGAMLP